jgi:hypothetical protein
MSEIERIISLIFRMEAGRRINKEEGGNFKCQILCMLLVHEFL